MIQLKNISATKAYTFNWSTGDQTVVAVSSVGDVPLTVPEAEVDLKIANCDDIKKLCGSSISGADLEVQYKALESNDVQFTISPTTVTFTTALPHTRDIAISVTTAAGERIASFNDYVTLTLSDDSSTGSLSYDADNDDLTIASSNPLIATLFLRNGYGVVTINALSSWSTGKTNTLTVSQATFYGVTLAAVTSVETITIA